MKLVTKDKVSILDGFNPPNRIVSRLVAEVDKNSTTSLIKFNLFTCEDKDIKDVSFISEHTVVPIKIIQIQPSDTLESIENKFLLMVRERLCDMLGLGINDFQIVR